MIDVLDAALVLSEDGTGQSLETTLSKIYIRHTQVNIDNSCQIVGFKRKDIWNKKITNVAVIKTTLRSRWMAATHIPKSFPQAYNYHVLLYNALYLACCTHSYRLRIKLINTKSGHRSNDLNLSIWLQDCNNTQYTNSNFRSVLIKTISFPS